jgi:hypothetical protein
MDMEEEVKEAYEVVKRIDVLDVSVGKFRQRIVVQVITISFQRELRYG